MDDASEAIAAAAAALDRRGRPAMVVLDIEGTEYVAQGRQCIADDFELRDALVGGRTVMNGWHVERGNRNGGRRHVLRYSPGRAGNVWFDPVELPDFVHAVLALVARDDRA